ncbi:MAG TPA: winged helix-turn-helix domain-containing protein [Blastocatellia bacterium]|nr:winged helix-turn-helix domain-containing protein [Blastocatellia bacterium]HMX28738.1 winged helix-turn-helix domain-containing protein [Blastocatellia bacterium]HMY72099.1 winged helix-turn-helix domain-containing protein [Blastocatellia bacterium]HNG28390.1 winged helix-turn-helix domain-containing protein [Blastocatellia bacterium]
MKMVGQEQIAAYYGFGPFVADTTKCVLLRNGETVPLSLKAFEILLLLIERRGQVVEKDEILKRVWPNTVVEENNLARNISTLRKALDEHPNEHQYILTVPGRGYRFVAGVRELEDLAEGFGLPVPDQHNSGAFRVVNGQQALAAEPATPPPVPAAETLVPEPARQSRRTVLIFGIASIGVALFGLLFFLLRPSRQIAETPPRKLWQLTFDSGLESEPSWSPDGRLIAYSADRGGNFDIWVQPVGEGNPIRVTNSPAHDWQPDWSPEGNRLVFRSERDGGGLFVVPVLGGNERRISGFGYRPHFSPDGTQILFTSTLRPVTEIPKVYVVGLDGKPPREVLTNFLPEFTLLHVAWHPDGKRLSLWGNHRQQGRSFWTAPLDGGAPVKSEIARTVEQRLKDADVHFTDFRWSPSVRELYFEGVSGSVRNLWKVEVEPESLRWTAGPEQLTTGTSLDTDLTVSPNGKRIAFTSRTENIRLWSLPFDAAAGRVKQAGQPVTAPGVNAYYPDLSPDGQRLVYLAQRVGKEEMRERWLKDGRETLLMAAEELISAHPRWSPDGRRLAYDRSRPAHPGQIRRESSLYLLSPGEGEGRQLTAPGKSRDVVWDWSPDGQAILGGAYPPGSSRRIIGLFPLAATPNAERELRVIASHPEQNLYQSRYSPDGRWIGFVAAKAFDAGISTIYVIPSTGGEWTRITEGKFFDDKPRWSPDGRKLYFLSNRTGFFNVWGIGFDPATGQPVGEPFRVTMFESPAQMVLPDVTVMEMTLSADRLILPIMEVSGGIWILENLER